MEMGKLTKEQLNLCSRTLSSTALAATIIHNILSRVPTSVVRMGDGELAIIRSGKNPTKGPKFLTDKKWLEMAGVDGMDLGMLSRKLFWAGQHATYFAPSLSGLYLKQYDLYPVFGRIRPKFIDVTYPMLWYYGAQVRHILKAAPVLVLSRQADTISKLLATKYDAKVSGFELASWKDHDAAKAIAKQSLARTILVAGGPAGKPLVVELAKETGKVVLDLGRSLTKW
jgi:hypothetical protein